MVRPEAANLLEKEILEFADSDFQVSLFEMQLLGPDKV